MGIIISYIYKTLGIAKAPHVHYLVRFPPKSGTEHPEDSHSGRWAWMADLRRSQKGEKLRLGSQ